MTIQSHAPIILEFLNLQVPKLTFYDRRIDRSFLHLDLEFWLMSKKKIKRYVSDHNPIS